MAVGVPQTLTEDWNAMESFSDPSKVRGDTSNRQSGLEQLRTKLEVAQARLEAEAEVQAEVEAARVEGLIGQVRLCEEFLDLPPRPAEQLEAMSVDELERLVAQLRGLESG